MKVLTNIGRLVTGENDVVISDASIVIADDRITWSGPQAELPSDARSLASVDLGGALVTPGLVDAHSHPVYVKPRLAEIADRSKGVSYGEIGRQGGGIHSTVASMRSQPVERLRNVLERRLRRWLYAGTTTLEVKTGYRLDEAGELASIRLLQEISTAEQVPRMSITFLGPHAVPRDEGLSSFEFARLTATWVQGAVKAGARHCDAFCDVGYFSVREAELFLQAGASVGLRSRVHADELERTGGAQLAARLRAASADHLLCASPDDARALARAHVAAVLCPATAASLNQRPPMEAFDESGVVLALGSDHNPGTSGLTAMSTVVALAIHVLGMSVIEAIQAATHGGAQSLGYDDRGRVAPGCLADLVAWDADHEGGFAWSWELQPTHVWVGGAESRRSLEV